MRTFTMALIVAAASLATSAQAETWQAGPNQSVRCEATGVEEGLELITGEQNFLLSIGEVRVTVYRWIRTIDRRDMSLSDTDLIALCRQRRPVRS